MTQDALIESALDQILAVWQVDSNDLRSRGANGFDWLPGSYIVSVRAVPADKSDPFYVMLQGIGGVDPRENGVRLSVSTRMVEDFPLKSSQAVTLLDQLSPMLCSTYSLVYPPQALLEASRSVDAPHDLELFSSVYIDPNLAGWLPNFLAQMAVMQPIDAELHGSSLPAMFGGGLPAFEDGVKRKELDDILNVAEQIFVPAGARPSKWSGSDEFVAFARDFGRSENCFANGDSTGLTAEVPFGNGSALIQLWTDQFHPNLGNGLLVTLLLPHKAADESDGGVAALNYLEARAWTEFPNFGCWHQRDTGSDRGILPAHSTFIPNALYRPDLIQNLALWEMARARWVRQTFYPDMQDRLMSDILEERFR